MAFSLFSGKHQKPVAKAYKGTPVIRCSIWTGEQVAGFIRKEDGTFEEIMLIRDAADLQFFRDQYGIAGDIKKIY